MSSLWGSVFEVEKTPSKAAKIKKKIEGAKKEKSNSFSRTATNPRASHKDRISAIREEVYRILGSYKDNTQVITTPEELHLYIDSAISNGIIAIDTETNNSLQPVSCKLMGACIYTPGQKQAYIPVNHINIDTREKLAQQCTEEDIYKEFSRLSSTKIIMHNGKFDYEVLKCTCGLELALYWDTLIGAKLLNENEKGSLKEQYISKIDSSIEKYSIEKLFAKMPYEIFDPELFALYAATDAYMTYKLYEWQLEKMNLKENARIKKLFFDVEMPVITVTAEMELYGVSIDKEYSDRLSKKYHDKEDEMSFKIQKELDKLLPQISLWRETEEANFHPKSTKPNKDGEYTFSKSKNEQLSDPPQLTSPTQLSILLYDVLKIDPVDKKNPRGTGDDILAKIDHPLCNLIRDQRGLQKLISTYIDKMVTCVNPVDNRLHASFNQYGAKTGRFSSNEPNLQNIPSHELCIRMLFIPSQGYSLVGSDFSLQSVG